MNLGGWLLWGFVGTIVLTSIMAASQGLGLTRISIPYLLGTLLTPDRDRAKRFGFLAHLLIGWLLSLIYIAAFHAWHAATLWRGTLIGFVHGAFVLSVGLPFLPSVHPRMANEQQGPTVLRQLEPPGFLGMNYGYQTPVYVLAAHLVFGAILGAFYTF